MVPDAFLVHTSATSIIAYPLNDFFHINRGDGCVVRLIFSIFDELLDRTLGDAWRLKHDLAVARLQDRASGRSETRSVPTSQHARRRGGRHIECHSPREVDRDER